jgi:hypothetical protein
MFIYIYIYKVNERVVFLNIYVDEIVLIGNNIHLL